MANNYATDNGRYVVALDGEGNEIGDVAPFEAAKRVTLRPDNRVQCTECPRKVAKGSVVGHKLHSKNDLRYVCPFPDCDHSEDKIAQIVYHCAEAHSHLWTLHWRIGFKSFTEAKEYVKRRFGEHKWKPSTATCPSGRDGRSSQVCQCAGKSDTRSEGCFVFFLIQKMVNGECGVLSNSTHWEKCDAVPRKSILFPPRAARFSESDNGEEYDLESDVAKPQLPKRARLDGQGTSAASEVEKSGTSPLPAEPKPELTVLPPAAVVQMDVGAETNNVVSVTRTPPQPAVVAACPSTNMPATEPCEISCQQSLYAARRNECLIKIDKYNKEKEEIAEQERLADESFLLLEQRVTDQFDNMTLLTEAQRVAAKNKVNTVENKIKTAQKLKEDTDNHKKATAMLEKSSEDDKKAAEDDKKATETKEKTVAEAKLATEEHRSTNLLLQAEKRARAFDKYKKLLDNCDKKIADERKEIEMWEDEEKNNM